MSKRHRMPRRNRKRKAKGIWELRKDVHEAFDPYWQHWGYPRGYCYMILGNLMGMSPGKCHVRLFTEEECKKAIQLIESMELILTLKRLYQTKGKFFCRKISI